MSEGNEQASGSGLRRSGNSGDKSSETLFTNPYHGRKNRDKLSKPSLIVRTNSLPSFRDLHAASDNNSVINRADNC